STDSSRKLAVPVSRSRRYAPRGVSRSVAMTVMVFMCDRSSRTKKTRNRVCERCGMAVGLPTSWRASAPLVAPRPSPDRAGRSHCLEDTSTGETIVIEMLTAFAVLTAYLASFVDWQRQSPDPAAEAPQPPSEPPPAS